MHQAGVLEPAAVVLEVCVSTRMSGSLFF